MPEVVPKRRKASKKKDPPAEVVQVESVDDVDQGAPSTAEATATVATTSEATGASDPVETPSDADVATTPAEEVAATPAASSNRDGNRADRSANAGAASQDQEPTPTAAPGGNEGTSQRGNGKGNRNRSGTVSRWRSCGCDQVAVSLIFFSPAFTVSRWWNFGQGQG